MATDPSSEYIARPGTKPEGGAAPKGAAGALEKFKGLPRPAQVAILIGGLLFVFYIISSLRGGNSAPQSSGGVVNLGQPDGQKAGAATFSGMETDRPAVMQSVFEQNRRDMADLRTKIEGDFATRDQALQSALGQNQELQRQMQQMMGDFTTELKNIQVERARDSERLGQLADQQKQLEMNSPVDGSTAQSPVGVRKRAISQVSLGGGGAGGVAEAIARPFGQLGANASSHLNNSGMPVPSPADDAAAKRLPFMPPLGFVHAKLLNGVDAVVGGATPSLARLSGTYKTAMNTTVTLDGCFALIEFEANLSTERATGKPVRMTCIYPDNGAATYSLSGYAVDSEDGIIGVPGVLFEGDPSRIGAAMLADFTAGIVDIVASNNTGEDATKTGTVDGNGNVTITANQGKSQVLNAGNTMTATIRDYLKARVDRIQSFIRLDATRDINFVILGGTEMRKEGDVWSQLFDANNDGGTPRSNLPAGTVPTNSNINATPSGGQ